MIASLPPGWSTADFNAWFNPIYLDATAQRDVYVYAHTPRELQTNVAEWLVTGSTSSPLPISWSMKEFTDWITALINEALAAYYVDILSQTPAYLLSPVKERINYQQPPPTTDLIGGGGALTPGTPGVPGVLPAGATLTRASTAWYWEGSNYISNPSATGAVPGSPGTQPTGWSMSSTANAVTRTIVGSGVEDGIPYLDVRFAGTPTAPSSVGIAAVVSTVVIAAFGETWVGSFYIRLVGGSMANIINAQHFLTERDAAGAILVNTLTPYVPTGAALKMQKVSSTRTLDQPTAGRVTNQWGFNYTLGNAIDVTFRLGLPTLTTTSKPFVPQLIQANIDAPRFPVDPTTGAALGLHNEPAATNSIPNASALGAVGAAPGSGAGTPPTGWFPTSATNGLLRTIIGRGSEDGIEYCDIQFSGTVTGSSAFLNIAMPTNTAVVAASIGQAWVGSFYLRLVGGSLTGVPALQHFMTERDAGGVGLTSSNVNVSVTAAALRTQRFNLARTLASAGTAFVTTSIFASIPVGNTIDFTLRIGLPQLVQAPAPTSPIVTTTVALTRAADVFNAPVPNGTYDIDVVRGTTTTYASQVITTAKWLVPNDPSPVRSVAAKVVAAEARNFNFMSGAGLLPAGATLARASIGWAMSVPNTIRNTTMAGASVSPANPGVLPTNWALAGTRGTLQTELSTVVVDGVTCLRFRAFGTTSSTTFGLYFEAANFIPALTGQSWTASFRAAISAGSLSNISSVVHYVVERTSAGGFIKGNQAFVALTGALSLSSTTTVLSGGATTAFVQPGIVFNFASGVNIDFTLDIGLPSLANAVPVLTSYAIDTPRWPVDPTSGLPIGLYNERAVTNFVRNASCGGVVPGTPGTAPTLWNVASTANGITRECVGSGVEDGIPYFDVRYFGTPSGGSSATIRPEAPTTTVAAAGETWLAQFNYRLMAGSMTNAGVRVVLGYRDGGGTGISGPATTVVTPTNAPLRTQSATMSWTAPATTATVNSDIRVDWTVGNAIDITLRVGAPQMIQLDTPRSPILSTNAALLRAADVLTAAQANVLPGFWDVTVTRQSGATVARGIDLTAGGTLTYVVPTDASPVQSVKFAPSV